MHIIHEIAHAFLCLLGFTPILDRQFKNNSLRAFESMEWQAKALAGEIMMDYEKTKRMSVLELSLKCGVSEDSAMNRVKLR